MLSLYLFSPIGYAIAINLPRLYHNRDRCNAIRDIRGATQVVDTLQLIVSAINSSTKEELFGFATELASTVTSQKITDVLNGSYQTKTRDQVSSSGYVVDSLEAALWAFANGDDFEQGALLAVNLADDADTVGAIYGQLAGAYYGKSGIPVNWIEKLYTADMIENLAKLIVSKIGTYAIKSAQYR